MLALTSLNVTASAAHRLQLIVMRGAAEDASAGSSEPALGSCAGGVGCGAEQCATSFTSCAEPEPGARPASSKAIVPARSPCRPTRNINVPDSHDFACILCCPNAAFNPRSGPILAR